MMIEKSIGIPEVAGTLLRIQGWDTLNAYERAKHCCTELTRIGASIPSWTVVRDIIGKGSAGDINRAKKDFRIEHGAALRKMEGFEGQGVPEALTPHIVGFWQEAIEHVRAEFTTKEQTWTEKVEHAQAAAEHAKRESDRAQAVAQTLQAEMQGLQDSIVSLRGQVATEQAARAQAERMAADTRADLIGQRDRLDEALAHAQEGLSTAIARLEGTERRAKMETERARQEAAQKIATISSHLEREQSKYHLDTTRLEQQLKEARAHAIRVQESNAVLVQENRLLHERAQRAEHLADRLQSQNTELLSAIPQPAKLKGKIERKNIRTKLRRLRSPRMGREGSA